MHTRSGQRPSPHGFKMLVIPFLLAATAATADTHTGSPARAPAIKALQINSAPTATHGKFPPEMVAPGQKSFDGSYLETILYETQDKKYSVRIWESQPGVLQTDGYPYDEYCLVLEGQLEIANADGGRVSFKPGDPFVIPKGWRGTWNMKTHFKKHSIVLAPEEPGTR